MKRLLHVSTIACSAVFAISAVTACGSRDAAGQAPSGAATSPSPSPAMSAPATPSAGASADGGADSEHAMITIKDFGYEVPGSVPPGARITVVNNDSEAHTVTADDNAAFDVTIAPGRSATFTAPAERGRYRFTCSFHSNMHGTLEVG